jgi:hypothetical protein
MMRLRELLVLALLFCGATPSKASHFLGGTISYTIPNPINPRTVEFTLSNYFTDAQGFSTSYRLYFGDGTTETQASTNDGTLTDGSGEPYELRTTTYTHTYSGQDTTFQAYFGNCCRDSALVNDNGDYRLTVTVDLTNEKNSPIVQIPGIVQMYGDTNNVVDLKPSINDIYNDGITCSYADPTGAGISPIPTADGVQLDVTPDCKLQWDLSEYNPSTYTIFSASLWVLSSAGARVPFDFIIEIIDGTPTTCGVTSNNSLQLATSPGNEVTTQFQLNGGPPATLVSSVTTSLVGPGNPTLTPSTTSSSLPADYDFSYTVPAGTADGTQTQSTIQWTLANGQSCFQTVTVTVCADDDGDTVCNEADQCPKADDTVDLNNDGIPDCTQSFLGDGGANGDPHFKTWRGEHFDFHGECDLVLLQSKEFESGLGLDVHIRTKMRRDMSYISSAVLRIRTDVLEVESQGIYYINGVAGAVLPSEFGGFEFLHTQPTDKQHVFEVHLGGKERIKVKTYKDFVSVLFEQAELKHFGKSVGLMGAFGTGHMIGRDGKTVIDDANAFGQEWQVLDTEPSLFQTVRFPQHPTVCTMPTPVQASQLRRRLSEESEGAELAAEKACEHWGEGKDDCVFDVLTTGDLDMAVAGTY